MFQRGPEFKIFSGVAHSDEARFDPFSHTNFLEEIVNEHCGRNLDCDWFSADRANEHLELGIFVNDEMDRRFLLNAVVLKRAAVFKLGAAVDEALLIRRNVAFLLVDHGLDVVDRFVGFDIEKKNFARD